jgi:membrane-bound metal-dependent hydrolase YbcI (DUF457 family)
MLPPGHIAAGFLTAKALLHFAHPGLSAAQQTHLLWWGAFFGFAPDLDNFVAFAKVRAWWYKPGTDSNIHRRFYSHLPVLWLFAGLLIYVFAWSPYYKMFGLVVWLGSWSHFLLDSIDIYGIMWLWPFNKEIWALKDRGVDVKINSKGFFEFWFNFLKFYVTRWTFYVELVLLISTLFFLFTNY